MGRMTPKSKSKLSGRQRQTRLDEHLTPPRRSTRLRSGTLEKQEITDIIKSTPDLKKIDTTVLEVEPSTSQHITLLLTTKSSSKSLHSKAEKSKSKGRKTDAQKDIKLNEVDQLELLKKFDLNPAYGPCRGISRRERYLRAIKYELKPVPDDIIQILDEHGEDPKFQNCIWDQNGLLKLRIE